MSKDQRSQKMDKKPPTMTKKEKKAAKRDKDDVKPFLTHLPGNK